MPGNVSVTCDRISCSSAHARSPLPQGQVGAIFFRGVRGLGAACDLPFRALDDGPDRPGRALHGEPGRPYPALLDEAGRRGPAPNAPQSPVPFWLFVRRRAESGFLDVLLHAGHALHDVPLRAGRARPDARRALYLRPIFRCS